MMTMTGEYLRRIEEIYNHLDINQEVVGLINEFHKVLREEYDQYLDTLNNASVVFQNTNVNTYQIPATRDADTKIMPSELFVENVIETKLKSAQRFKTEILSKLKTKDDFIELRHKTMAQHPSIRNNHRIAMYTLYTKKVCTTKDYTVQLFNDPTVSGFVELANKRYNNLRQAETDMEYKILIGMYFN